MRKLFSILVVVTALLVSFPASASSEFNNTVGFTAGATTGLGLTYRLAYNDWFGQLALMPLWNKEDGGRMFAGTQFGRRIQGDDQFYLNVALGLGVMYSQGQECNWVEQPRTNINEPPIGEEVCNDYQNTYLAGGPSIGLGRVWGNHFHTELYIPIAAVWKVGEGLDAVVPYPGVTVGYRW